MSWWSSRKKKEESPVEVFARLHEAAAATGQTLTTFADAVRPQFTAHMTDGSTLATYDSGRTWQGYLNPNEALGQRGSGRTTKQMKEAPKGAVYIATGRASQDYCKDLARTLGRTDLKIETAAWLDNVYHWRGLDVPLFPVLDHATCLTEQQRINYQELLSYYNTRAASHHAWTEPDYLFPREKQFSLLPKEEQEAASTDLSKELDQ